MSTTYRWLCQACGASNAPAAVCAQCGFPAEASAEETALAKSHGVNAVYQKRETNKKAKAEWLAQPLWRKIGDVIALAMIVTGLLLVRLTVSIEQNVLGAALAGLPIIWMWFIHKR